MFSCHHSTFDRPRICLRWPVTGLRSRTEQCRRSSDIEILLYKVSLSTLGTTRINEIMSCEIHWSDVDEEDETEEASNGAWVQSVFTSPPLVAQLSAFHKLEYILIGCFFGKGTPIDSELLNSLIGVSSTEKLKHQLSRALDIGKIHWYEECKVPHSSYPKTQNQSHPTSTLLRKAANNPDALSSERVKSSPFSRILARPSPHVISKSWKKLEAEENMRKVREIRKFSKREVVIMMKECSKN
uniref:Uncharacterized protein n=1 Tax=Cucumis melo TaxID=3656 RepID=A0A9I9E7D2_CUCME